MTQQSCKLGSVTLIVALFGSALSATAGSLTPPPGPIKPTNRVQINQQFGALPIIIDQPGSYVLTGNIVAPPGYTGNGIQIKANDVTLDLNGFAVMGVGGNGDGITTDVGFKNTTVRNGSVLDWGNNGVALLGIDGAHTCENVRATNNGFGIVLEGSGNITRCVASENAAEGITGAGVISHCTAEGNGRVGIWIISTGASRVVSCFTNDNANDGIFTFAAVTVIDCQAGGNAGYGFNLEGGGSVVGNTCFLNGVNNPQPNSGGILIFGPTLVEGNHLVGNQPNGIEVVLSTNSTIIKNVVRFSTNSYVIQAGNDVGPISTAATATSPWANITD